MKSPADFLYYGLHRPQEAGADCRHARTPAALQEAHGTTSPPPRLPRPGSYLHGPRPPPLAVLGAGAAGRQLLVVPARAARAVTGAGAAPRRHLLAARAGPGTGAAARRHLLAPAARAANQTACTAGTPLSLALPGAGPVASIRRRERGGALDGGANEMKATSARRAPIGRRLAVPLSRGRGGGRGGSCPPQQAAPRSAPGGEARPGPARPPPCGAAGTPPGGRPEPPP